MSSDISLPDMCSLRGIVAFVSAQEQIIRETLGVSLMQVLTLCALFRKDEHKPGVLAELVGLSPSGFSRILSELESFRYIRRNLATEDKRSILVDLTALGKKKAQALLDWELLHFPMKIEFVGNMAAIGGKL